MTFYHKEDKEAEESVATIMKNEVDVNYSICIIDKGEDLDNKIIAKFIFA